VAIPGATMKNERSNMEPTIKVKGSIQSHITTELQDSDYSLFPICTVRVSRHQFDSIMEQRDNLLRQNIPLEKIKIDIEITGVAINLLGSECCLVVT
jgi:hypothetical protein